MEWSLVSLSFLHFNDSPFFPLTLESLFDFRAQLVNLKQKLSDIQNQIISQISKLPRTTALNNEYTALKQIETGVLREIAAVEVYLACFLGNKPTLILTT